MITGISLLVASERNKKGVLVSPYCYVSQIIGKKFFTFHLLSIAVSTAISFLIAFAVYSVMRRSQVIIIFVKKNLILLLFYQLDVS